MGIFIYPLLLLLLYSGQLYAASELQPPTPSSTSPATTTDSSPAPTQADSPISQTTDNILPLEIVINGTKSGTWLLVEHDGEMYAPADAFEEWRVQLPPDVKSIKLTHFDQPYLPLSAVPGYRFKMDFANQSAELLFSPQVFSATRLTQEKSKKPVTSKVLPSLFLNYDLNYSTSILRDAHTIRDLGLLTEFGASNSLGVITTSHIGRNLTNDDTLGNPRTWVRLETTYTKDFPDRSRTLRLGDTSTREGLWSRNIYFGGVQYGSNFALTPGFVSQPIPALVGVSTAPSSVEMYVNDVLRQVSKVPTGPFAIDNFPLLTGSGDVRMVVRDIFGRETVIEQSFFITTDLLSAGLNDWSIEAGRLRQDIGVASSNYGPKFVSGMWRHGYNNDITLESHAEATSQQRALGLSVVSTLPKQILGKASLAISSEQNQKGAHWLLGLEQQRLRSNVSFQVKGSTVNFRQIGQDNATSPTKLQIAGNWSYSPQNTHSFGLGLASISLFDNTRITTLSGNYSVRVGKHSNLSFTASRAIAGADGTSAGIFLVIPMDNNITVSSSANVHGDQQDFYTSASRNPNHESNFGWRTLAGYQQDRTRAEGGIFFMGRYGRVSSDVSTSSNQTAIRIGASGGLVLVDKHLFPSEQVNQSLAVVEIGGYNNVGIGLGNHVLTHTHTDGIALLPRLLPYQNNAIRLDPNDLPMSAEVDTIELNVVPAWRSVVKVVFPVRGGRGALLTVMFEDGEVAPPGATMKIEGDTQEFYIARRGQAYITGLQPSNHVLLNWNNQQCKIDVTLPPEIPDEISRIGPLLCKGITR